MSFVFNGTLFPEGEGARVQHTGKLRIRRDCLADLVAYLSNAPTTVNGVSDAEEVILYLKGWRKARGNTTGTYISFVAEPAAAVVRELQARGKMKPQEDAQLF